MKKIIFTGNGADLNKNEVHFVGLQNDYTLCGYTMDGDFGTAGEYMSTNKKVNCRHCIEIVKACKKVMAHEYKCVN